MKFWFPITCSCGESFRVEVNGNQPPKDAECPKCRTTIWLVEPLGNVVGMAILSRAETEMNAGDWTLTIVLSAMAVECQLAFLFMKWNRIDLMLVRNPTDADEEGWETQWRDEVRTIAARFDKVSSILTRQPFDTFLDQNGNLLRALQTKYQNWNSATSFKDLFVKELFHKRNRVVHFGKIDFSRPEAEMCSILASTLWQILVSMDAHRRRELEAKYHVGTQNPS
jgi:hypothetical protein